VLHLVTHAFFKACLFLGAGSVMHGMGDETDIRKMGGLAGKMPHTHWTFLLATIAATGIVPLSGFWSKDAILGNALFSSNPAWHAVGPIAYVVGSLAALGTAFYMTRLYWLTFQGKPRTHAAEHAHESSFAMTIPLMVLAVLAAVALILGLPGHTVVSELFAHYIEPVFAPGTERLLEVGHFHAAAHPPWPYFAAWAIALGGSLIGFFMYGRGWLKLPAALATALPKTYALMVDKFRVDELYEAAVIGPLKSLAHGLWRFVDVTIIDGLFVNGIPRLLGFLGGTLRLAQNGDIQRYAALMALAAAAILWTVLGAGSP
jgi:NADH-quinone oxidoreductase subunit L